MSAPRDLGGIGPDKMKSALRRAVVGIALAGAAGSAWPVSAYNEDGHFYSVVAELRARTPAFAERERAEAIVTAFCAQMPDLAMELDAVTLRVGVAESPSNWGWSVLGQCWTTEVTHMDTAHELIHALTGTKPKPVTDAAVAIITELRTRRATEAFDPVRACAIGFGVHLLGDSFAHQRIGEEGMFTYPPGMGHWRDNHSPDYIVYNGPRERLWEDYLQKLSQALDLDLDAPILAAFHQIATDNFAGRDDDNKYNQAKIIARLKEIAGAAGPDAETIRTPGDNPSPPAVETYNDGAFVLKHSFDEVVSAYRAYLPLGDENLQYKDVWNLYMPVATSAFRQQGIRPTCSPEMSIP